MTALSLKIRYIVFTSAGTVSAALQNCSSDVTLSAGQGEWTVIESYELPAHLNLGAQTEMTMQIRGRC